MLDRLCKASGIDQYVRPPIAVAYICRKRIQGIAVGNRSNCRAMPFIRQTRDNVLRFAQIALSYNDNRCASLCQPYGSRLSDSPCAADHHRDFSIQSFNHDIEPFI